MQTIKLYRVTYPNGIYQGVAYTASQDFVNQTKAERFANKCEEGVTITEWTRKCSQKDLNFWLASFVQRGCDHTPEWVTVSLLLKMGANPTVSPMGHRGMRLPSPVETCREMAEAYDPDHGRMLVGWRCTPDKAREICEKTQKHYLGYLNQFAKAGYPIA